MTAPQKRAFTVIEILIAASLLVILFGGAFGIYRSGSQNFALGDWKIHTQKEAQSFLAVIGAELNQANNVYAISSDTYQVIAKTPILLNKNAFALENDVASKSINVLGSEWVPLIFFSITKPYIEKSKFSTEEVLGSWKGISIWGNNGRLIYSRVGNTQEYQTQPHQMPPAILSDAVPGVSSQISPAPDAKRSVILKDVESISFVMKTRGENQDESGSLDRVLQIKVLMRRPALNRQTTVAESVDAAILNNVDIREF